MLSVISESDITSYSDETIPRVLMIFIVCGAFLCIGIDALRVILIFGTGPFVSIFLSI
jgi:hypothetical protein